MLEQPIWQTGFKVTLGTAVLQPATPSCSPGLLTIDAEFENRTSESFSFPARILLSSAGQDYEVSNGASEIPEVPGGRKGKGSFAFTVDRGFTLEDAALIFGGADRHQALVELGKEPSEQVVTLEPQTVPIKGQFAAGKLAFSVEGAFVSADAYWEHDSLAQDEAGLRVDFNATYSGSGWAGGVLLSDENLSLELPDGTSIVPLKAPLELFEQAGTTISDLWVRFIIPAPVAGQYKLTATGRWAGENQTEWAEAQFPFELPSMPTFGEE